MSRSSKYSLAAGLALVLFPPPINAHETSFDVLYTFCSQPGCTDGGSPQAGLITDSEGNIYGTTAGGGSGSGSSDCATLGCGTIFKLTSGGNESVLYSFCSNSQCTDGETPSSGLIRDGAGNVFGTTTFGGKYLYGTVFKVRADNTEQVLHDFPRPGGPDGFQPFVGLTAVKDLRYGITPYGGGGAGCGGEGCGAIFEIEKAAQERVLYAFAGGSDGGFPQGGLIADRAGNLYGMTDAGGNPGCLDNQGCGTVFRMAPDGIKTVLHDFAGSSDGSSADGSSPTGSLIADKAGNLYGTTEFGGAGGENCTTDGNGCGTIFKLAPDGTESVIYSFRGGSDGKWPLGGLVMDVAGNLYGTTMHGGGVICREKSFCSRCGNGCGTIFKVTPAGSETVIHVFTGLGDGSYPAGSLIADNSGRFYGTASGGGNTNDRCYDSGGGCGVLFRVSTK